MGRTGSNVSYYELSDGRWIRREWKRQCSSKVFFYGRCQEVKGHKGVHWCYSPSGSYQWHVNEDNLQHEVCAGSTRPCHKSYVSPAKMEKHYYMNHYKDAEVTDKAVIATLKRNKPPERDAAIDRPVFTGRKPRRSVAK